jgi:hypothetical protein
VANLHFYHNIDFKNPFSTPDVHDYTNSLLLVHLTYILRPINSVATPARTIDSLSGHHVELTTARPQKAFIACKYNCNYKSGIITILLAELVRTIVANEHGISKTTTPTLITALQLPDRYSCTSERHDDGRPSMRNGEVVSPDRLPKRPPPQTDAHSSLIQFQAPCVLLPGILQRGFVRHQC